MTAPDLVLVDSSGWLECLTLDAKAKVFAPYLTGRRRVVVPTMVLYEVYKKLLQGSGKTAADAFVSQALRQQVVPLDEAIALSAAEVSIRHKLAMADAIIFTTASFFGAELVTSDQAFRNLPGVTVL